MNEEFYCCLKLVSGEEVISEIMIDDNDTDPVIVMQTPLKVETMTRGSSGYMKLVPWMSVPDDDIFIIKPDKVITMTELPQDHEMVEAYQHYNMQRAFYVDGERKVRVSKQMGSLGSVKDARSNLEKIYNTTADHVSGIATHA